MTKKECEVCKKMIKEKYKHYRLWKALAIIFMALAIAFGTLYFASGDVFRHTVNNDVEIVNEGGGNNNNNVAINN